MKYRNINWIIIYSSHRSLNMGVYLNLYCIFVLQVPDILVYNVDISDWDKTSHVVRQIGPVDILVNNAAVLISKHFLEYDKEDLFR